MCVDLGLNLGMPGRPPALQIGNNIGRRSRRGIRIGIEREPGHVGHTIQLIVNHSKREWASVEDMYKAVQTITMISAIFEEQA